MFALCVSDAVNTQDFVSHVPHINFHSFVHYSITPNHHLNSDLRTA